MEIWLKITIVSLIAFHVSSKEQSTCIIFRNIFYSKCYCLPCAMFSQKKSHSWFSWTWYETLLRETTKVNLWQVFSFQTPLTTTVAKVSFKVICQYFIYLYTLAIYHYCNMFHLICNETFYSRLQSTTLWISM